MANAARLEIDFPFGGKTYSIKPTFEAIAGVEAATGQACIALAEKCWAQDPKNYPSLTETSQMVYALIKPFADKNFTPMYVAETLVEDGCDGVWQPLGSFLARCLRGNKGYLKIIAGEAKSDNATDPPQSPAASTSSGG